MVQAPDDKLAALGTDRGKGGEHSNVGDGDRVDVEQNFGQPGAKRAAGWIRSRNVARSVDANVAAKLAFGEGYYDLFGQKHGRAVQTGLYGRNQHVRSDLFRVLFLESQAVASENLTLSAR